MANDFIVTRTEFADGMQEMVNNIQASMDAFNELKRFYFELQKAHNILTEVTGLNQFLIEKFIPAPLRDKAVIEYRQQREAMIKAEAHGAQPN